MMADEWPMNGCYCDVKLSKSYGISVLVDKDCPFGMNPVGLNLTSEDWDWLGRMAAERDRRDCAK